MCALALNRRLSMKRPVLQFSQKRHQATFSVLHWNVLASYLGKNTNPWFLHGISLDKERRKKIFEEYYSTEPSTKLLRNPGWPSYAKGILNPHEMKIIEKVDAELFSWPKRLEKIKQICVSHQADVLSLVELDAFETILKHMNNFGYSGEFVARPRLVSKDGCGIFWRRSEFKLLAKSKVIFIDTYNPDPLKDRCALIVLLEHQKTKEPFVIVSTHLARDVANEARDAVRARQLGELAVHVRNFMLESSISLYDCPVIVCGDINAVSMAKLTGLVQVSSLMACTGQKLHPFVFTSRAVETGGATSRTEAREVRVDAILHPVSVSEAQSMELSPEIERAKRLVIPNEAIPSDHYPILAQIGSMSNSARVAKAVRKWWSVILPSTRKSKRLWERIAAEEDSWVTDVQLDPRDLAMAFEKIDINKSGVIEIEDAMESLSRLDLLSSLSSEARKTLLNENVYSKLEKPNKLDLVEFCAMYFLVHPVCNRCADVAFDYIDASPRNDLVTMDELARFFEPFSQSPLEGDAVELFEDAKARGLADDANGINREAFKLLLGVRFVEIMFEDGNLRRAIVKRMGAERSDI